MKSLYDLKAYNIQDKQIIEEIKGQTYLIEHIKSGSKIIFISCEDENKVFSIGFKTPAENNKGIPHILEHSVLSGSNKYPAKNTFVELIKGSMNTFLNAMTFPDKTLYPIASCNDRDFKNLMSVYTDAVFRPNIYEKEEIFLQEGWNYQLDSYDSDLKYNGIVYNEMKGVFAAPETILYAENMRTLFPGTQYSYVAGGVPEAITDLSYNELLSYHEKYYHPSNSYIYLYGNMDIVERLQWLDETYLSKYEKVSTDFKSQTKNEHNIIPESTVYYPIGDGETEKDSTFLSYNTVIGKATDSEIMIAFDILNYTIMDAPGAALRQAILDKGIAKSVNGVINSSIEFPVFSIVANNSNKDSKEAFRQIIKDKLKDLVEKGIDKDTLNGAINKFEFRYKEADFGSMPKGLIYGTQLYNSWVYDDNLPFEYLRLNKIFRSLKEKASQGYFEHLIEKYILDNSHSSLVQLIPRKGLLAKRERAQIEKLDSYKKSLSKDEIESLIENTRRLKEYQESAPTKEELDSIPILSLEDIGSRHQSLYNNIKKVEGTTIVHHDIFTNGIGYLKLSFDIKKIPSELLPYLGILKSVLGFVDTGRYDYIELSNIININTGGISAYLNFYPTSGKKDKFKPAFEINAKFLHGKLDFAFEIIDEIVGTSKMDNTKRLYEIISDMKAQLQMWIQNNGHMVAVLKSLSYNSAMEYYKELVSGLSFYHFIEDIEENFNSRKELLIDNLKKLMEYVFRPENMIVSYTSNKEEYKDFEKQVLKFKPKLYTNKVKEEAFNFKAVKMKEGLKISSSVQYVAQTGNFLEKFSYTGTLRVLKILLSYDYLWQHVREKGGAYGCMLNFGRNGDSYIASYRDPNLLETYQVYNNIPNFLESLNSEDDNIMAYIIGAIKEIDRPMTPYAKSIHSFNCYMSEITEHDIENERNEILNTKKEELIKLSPLITYVLEQENICAIGNEEKIEKERAIFDRVRHIF